MSNYTRTVKPSGGDSTSLADAIADCVALGADLTTDCCGTGSAGILTISIEGDWSGGADTTAATLNGFTTSTDYYIKIVTNSSNRAAAASWDTSKYILNGGASHALTVMDNHVWIDGLQMTGDNTKYSIYVNTISAGSWLKISNCRMASSYGIVLWDADITAYIWNCIFNGNNRGVYVSAGNAYIYNCTKYGGVTDGIEFDAGTHTLKNCVVFGNDDDFDTTGATVTIDHCASDDGDGDNALAHDADWSDDFVNAASGDFTIKTGSQLIGAAVVNPGSGLFLDDIHGLTRGTAWDAGADQLATIGGSSIVPQSMMQYMRMRNN